MSIQFEFQDDSLADCDKLIDLDSAVPQFGEEDFLDSYVGNPYQFLSKKLFLGKHQTNEDASIN